VRVGDQRGQAVAVEAISRHVGVGVGDLGELVCQVC
jgi:hypothetical protein